MSGQIPAEELFKPLYAPIPDSRNYLERIGIGQIEHADKETLDRLVISHQRTVPFENLDVYDALADISLGIPDLYDKIVLRRRGGYCFELNAAFSALLTSLGYSCYPVAVRVVQNFSCFMPLTHRATIVTIGGVRFFCDVGFGGPSPQGALLLDETGAQSSGTNTFVITKSVRGTIINLLAEGNMDPVLTFSEAPVDPVDFLALNEYSSKNKNSMFRNIRLCNLVTETGCVTLSDDVLKIHSENSVTEKTLKTETELRAALKEYFGIEVSFALKILGVSG